jgi:hypothetical protein
MTILALTAGIPAGSVPCPFSTGIFCGSTFSAITNELPSIKKIRMHITTSTKSSGLQSSSV